MFMLSEPRDEWVVLSKTDWTYEIAAAVNTMQVNGLSKIRVSVLDGTSWFTRCKVLTKSR